MLLVAAALAGARASAAEREYSVGAGVGTLLAPIDNLGASLAFSAAVTPSLDSLRLVRARGELEVFISDGAWAALPTISGDAGLRLGPVELYLTAGVELFGGASRDSYTVFANLGLLAGGGLSVRLSSRLRLGARSLLIWLPSFSAIKLDAPEGAPKPTFLGLSGMLTLEILGGEVPDDFDFDFGEI
jgi:hypothetical protein